MALDINIMCVKQKSESIACAKKVFYLERLNVNQTDDIYQDNWFLYNAIMGIGYNLYLKDTRNETYNLVYFEEKQVVANYFRHILQDEKKPSNDNLQELSDSVIFNEVYFDDFERLLEQFIKKSEVNTCIVFLDCK